MMAEIATCPTALRSVQSSVRRFGPLSSLRSGPCWGEASDCFSSPVAFLKRAHAGIAGAICASPVCPFAPSLCPVSGNLGRQGASK